MLGRKLSLEFNIVRIQIIVVDIELPRYLQWSLACIETVVYLGIRVCSPCRGEGNVDKVLIRTFEYRGAERAILVKDFFAHIPLGKWSIKVLLEYHRHFTAPTKIFSTKHHNN